MAGLPRLYLISDRRRAPDGDLLACLDAACAAGVRLIQLREKDLSARDLLTLGTQVRDLAARHGARLLINGRIDVALALGAGVHLPSDDPPVAEARRLLGPDALIGVSTHHLDEALAAARQGADFVTFGPVYDTPSKRGMGKPVGVAALSRAASACPVPLLALGGIDRRRVAAVMARGCHGVAMISEIVAATDPGGVVRDLLSALPSG